MKNEYIITEQYLLEKGLDLNAYAMSTDVIPALINKALDISITRCFYNFDNIHYESDIEDALDNDPKKVPAFKKLQYNVLYNLIFTTTDDPIDEYIDTIICFELNLGKINSVQKGLWYKNY